MTTTPLRPPTVETPAPDGITSGAWRREDPTHRKGDALGPALLAAVLAAGCGDPGARSDPPEPWRSANSPSPSTTPPAQLCTQLVGDRARRPLTGDPYGDYQSMGLSDGQYEILRRVVDAARAERADERAADRLIDRRARELCAKRYRGGEPTGGPWG